MAVAISVATIVTLKTLSIIFHDKIDRAFAGSRPDTNARGFCMALDIRQCLLSDSLHANTHGVTVDREIAFLFQFAGHARPQAEGVDEE